MTVPQTPGEEGKQGVMGPPGGVAGAGAVSGAVANQSDPAATSAPQASPFTPGPWKVTDLSGHLSIMSDDLVVARIANRVGAPFRPEHRANARLIAAAPDGLDANREAADFLRAYFGPVSSDDPRGWSDDDARDVCLKLEAAIRKATDPQP